MLRPCGAPLDPELCELLRGGTEQGTTSVFTRRASFGAIAVMVALGLSPARSSAKRAGSDARLEHRAQHAKVGRERAREQDARCCADRRTIEAPSHAGRG